MTSPWPDAVDKEARKVARTVARRFREYPTEDAYADMAEWLWRSHERIANTAEGHLWKEWGRLRAHLTYRATAWRAAAVGCEAEDIVFYGTGQIKDLLPSIFHGDPSTSFLDGMPRARQDPAHGGDQAISRLDVAWAFTRLSLDDQALLRARFAEDRTFEDVGREWGEDPAALRMRLTRIIRRLQDVLGGQPPRADGPGTRHVMSNAESKAATDGEN